MIIPIGHDQGIRRMPWVTIAIIAICTLVQLYATFAGPSEADIAHLRDQYIVATTPEEEAAVRQGARELIERVPILRWGYATGSGLGINLIASAFVHSGWLHLIGNMLFLWLAGSALEDRWGKARYLAFYLAGAIAATYAFEATYQGKGTILVGASGAISAAMGAFLVYFARTEITFWYLLFYRTGTFRVSALVALPLWLADQVLWAYISTSMGGVSGVAYAAHIGGFAFGVIAAFGAAKLFPGKDEDEDDVAGDDEQVERSSPFADRSSDPQLEDRVSQCMAAINARDVARVKMLASRAIIDLSRANKDARVLDIYNAIATQMSRVQLTDGAFVAAASAADDLGDPATYVDIARAMIMEHPGSIQVPKVMWRLAEVQRDAGDIAGATETLRALATRFPRDPFGQRANEAVAGR